MRLTQHLLEELQRETASTRLVLERIPESKLSWKPHVKSMSLGQLALHTAGLPGALAEMLNAPSRDVPVVPLPEAGSVAEILALLEEQVAIASNLLGSWSDEYLHDPFSWTMQGAVLNETARYEQVRSTLFNHWYHHRGQLIVYLRLLDVPVPGIYGPSADDA